MEKFLLVNLEIRSSFPRWIHIIGSFKSETSRNKLKALQPLLKMTLKLTIFCLANWVRRIPLQFTRRCLQSESNKRLNWIQITYRESASTALMAIVTKTFKTLQTTIRNQVFRMATRTKKEWVQEVAWWEYPTPRGHSSKRNRRSITKW